MVVSLAKDLSSFVVVHDITDLAENNNFRYVRHAALMNDTVLFVSEQGKEKNKLVSFEASKQGILSVAKSV
jgi:hypothetical protein